MSVRVLSTFNVVDLLSVTYKMLKYPRFDLSKSSNSIQRQYTSFGHTHSRAFSICNLFVRQVMSSAAVCKVSSIGFGKKITQCYATQTDTEDALSYFC